MALKVFDSRRDIFNVVITPEIRARFIRMEPGEFAPLHSHDVGQEIFLILAGQCEFEVEGEKVIVGPGQLLFVPRQQRHALRAIGDQPVTLYLSVTPHVEPTHTMDDDAGRPSRRYAIWTGNVPSESPPRLPVAIAFAQYQTKLHALVSAIERCRSVQDERLAQLLAMAMSEDSGAVVMLVDELSADLSLVFETLWDLIGTWNVGAASAGVDSSRGPSAKRNHVTQVDS